MTLAPGSKLGPYEILSSIGSGGMGEVWKARDTRLGRVVAIKKVKEQHSERFKQEARSIAALNHPNICQIFDIGDNYLILEYVEGKPLSSPLPEQEAVRLAIQIVTALEAAHKKGIIHRDLKPSNIMVSDEGTVKLLDFGLAKLYEQDASISSLPTEDFPATQVGAILGTVAYMSPEQAQGQPADERSDIFSFGLVLYEMLSGRRAFVGDSTPETLAALLRDEPDPLKAFPALEKIVKHCLGKQPSDRYQTMAEIKSALEKTIKSKVTVSSEEPQPSIAVLPFVNMSGDKEQEYFSDGLAEEIINALTKIPKLKVIARTSAFAFKGKDQDITKIAEALRVSNILEGSVRKSGNRIRVTAQLITASDGSHLWSERYDRDLTDVFAIQDEISQAIAEKLRVQLSAGRAIARHHTENVEAFNLYLKGNYHFKKYTLEAFLKAKEYFEQSIAMDANNPIVWNALARTYWDMGFLGYRSPKAVNSQCCKALQKALELDEMLPEALVMNGVLRFNEFDWKGAEREFLRALELNPESPDALSTYSLFYLVPMKRLNEAIDASQKVLELDPLAPYAHYHLGHRYQLASQYDNAIIQFKTALELDPQYPWAHMHLGSVYVEIGKLSEGIKSCETAASLGNRQPVFLASLGLAYGKADRVIELKKLFDELNDLSKRIFVSPMCFVFIYYSLGEMDKAFDWLDKAVDEKDGLLYNIINVSFSDPLSSHPRYKAVLRKMNLIDTPL